MQLISKLNDPGSLRDGFEASFGEISVEEAERGSVLEVGWNPQREVSRIE